MEVLIGFAAVVQIAFIFFASFDALYYHFYKFKLHLRSSTTTEHQLHTANALLFPVTIYFLFCGNFTGVALWLGIGAVAVTFGIELFDVFTEKTSRIEFGGLPAFEGVLHFLMGVLRALAFGVVLGTKHPQDFMLANVGLGKFWGIFIAQSAAPYPAWVVTMGFIMFLASLPMAALHVWHCFARKKVA